MSLKGLTIIFAGSGEFGIPTLQALLDSGASIACVYSQPDKPAGRGKEMTPTPITQFALDHQLSIVRTENINKETLPAADVLVVIAFGQKIAEQVVTHAKYKSINLHASKLPKYRGAAPINWAVINGETQTGNSVIKLAQKMDAGAILAQSTIDISPTETAGEVHDRLAIDGAPLVIKVIEELRDGTAKLGPQTESQATQAPKLSREKSGIDWTKSSKAIANQIRGMYPWPGCRLSVKDANGVEVDRITLVRATYSTHTDTRTPGIITTTGTIQCGDGAIEIIEIQPEGKKPMTLAAYRNGHDWLAGMKLESLL